MTIRGSSTQDAGEADAAQLPARELVHVARLERRIEAHRREHPVDLLLAPAGVAQAADHDEPLLEDAADAPPRIERGAGVLVDVLDRRA